MRATSRDKKGGVLLVSFMFLLSACKEDILHDIQENDANRVLVVLSAEGVISDKRREGDGWVVAVAKKDELRALRVLEKVQMFKNQKEEDISGSSSLVHSKEETIQRLETRQARALERTIEQFAGVDTARVHLHRGFKNVLSLGPEEGSVGAGVLLVVRQGLFSGDESPIRELVSGATGVAKDRVVVVVTTSGLSYQGKDEQEILPLGGGIANCTDCKSKGDEGEISMQAPQQETRFRQQTLLAEWVRERGPLTTGGFLVIGAIALIGIGRRYRLRADRGLNGRLRPNM